MPTTHHESMLNRRTVLGGAAVALVSTGMGGSAGVAHAQSAQKTFVLVHGTFLGGWCWRRVSDILEKAGHKVFSPTLTGLGERSHLLSKSVNLDTHIVDIVNVVKWESLQNVCLVAHSYGGTPGSGALEHIGARVSSIVWLDAFKPKNGDRMTDLSALFGRMAQQAQDKGEPGFAPPSSKPTPVFVNEKDADLLASKTTPQPVGTYMQPIKLSGAIEKVAKKTYIRLPKFPNPPFDKTLAECKADKSWTTIELAGSGHVAMLDVPGKVADLLMNAA